ncbi:MAG: hypothetical protein ACLSTV_05970 [Coriobacteriales bacterium]|jgi:hypothetical protein
MIKTKKQKWITLLAALALVLFTFFGVAFVAPVSAAGEGMWKADTKEDSNVFKAFPGEDVAGQKLI